LLIQDIGKPKVYSVPGVQHFVIAFIIGQKPHVVVTHDVFYILVSLFNKGCFFLGHDHIIQVERKTSPESHVVSYSLNVIKELGRSCHAGCLKHQTDDITKGSFGQDFIYVSHFFRDNLVKEYTAHRCFNDVISRCRVCLEEICPLGRIVLISCTADVGFSKAKPDANVHVHNFFVIGNNHFFRAVERHSCTLALIP